MNWMRDPTAETSPIKRPRVKPPASLDGLTIGLFDIGKARSDEFLDQVEKRFAERGLKTRRYAKPTNAKVAPAEVMQKVATEADVVLIALSD
jgi:phosphopantothenate synthetase